MASTAKNLISANDSSKESAVPKIEERNSEEIVIGLVGAVGSGCSTTAEKLKEILEEDYKYEGSIIKPSDLIEQNIKRLKDSSDISAEKNRIERLQRAGTALREEFGVDYIVDKCIAEIRSTRSASATTDAPRRYFTIIDSLKNPIEVKRLQRVYGGAFWLVGVFAPEETRNTRLQHQKYTKPQIASILDRDEDEGMTAGQNVKDTIQLSDYFIRNDNENADELSSSIVRFLELLFRVKIHTPTNDEQGMYAAMSAAMGSACLSRQVGAAILDTNGNIIADGKNDVPKFGGGTYGEYDGRKDKRCYAVTGKKCHNDYEKNDLMNEIVDQISSLGIRGATLSEVRSVVEKSRIRSLIEFSRSVHAEMDAILSVARSGSGALSGASLYTTTYPCHNCARHIVSAGISRVIYIEPYAKSLALKLHNDAISIHSTDEAKKVVFLQFEGVAPKNMLTLFDGAGKRKVGGKLNVAKPDCGKPWSQVPMDGFVTNENLVISQLRNKESTGS